MANTANSKKFGRIRGQQKPKKTKASPVINGVARVSDIPGQRRTV